MAKFEIPPFFQTRVGKWLVRAAGGLIAAAVILMIAYCAASKRPAFYREFEAVGEEERKKLGGEMVQQTLDCYSQIQESKTGNWTLRFSDKQLNGWAASNGAAQLSQVLPREIQNPRIAIHGDRFELAAQIRYGSFSATTCFTGSLSVPESGKIALRFRSAKLGVYPFDKNKIAEMLKSAIDKSDWNLELSSDGGDPVLTFRPNIILEKKFALVIESIQSDNDGQCQIVGTVMKAKKGKR